MSTWGGKLLKKKKSTYHFLYACGNHDLWKCPQKYNIISHIILYRRFFFHVIMTAWTLMFYSSTVWHFFFIWQMTLINYLQERTKRPELYQAIGMTSAAGVLLVGPPGCGKTSVARVSRQMLFVRFLALSLSLVTFISNGQWKLLM